MLTAEGTAVCEPAVIKVATSKGQALEAVVSAGQGGEVCCCVFVVSASDGAQRGSLV